MIQPLPISWFVDNLPEQQIVEDFFKETIQKNYTMSGFTPLDTSAIERVEILTSKGADDNEIYGVHRLNGESNEANLGLRFDLTVPLARYVVQHEGKLSFPFKRQHIAKVYRGERPQKGRYREFYQADIDIIGNGKLPLFADVEIISTIAQALKQLDFGDFRVHMNNKKFLTGFLEHIGIQKIQEVIAVIDKKDKVRWDKLTIMLGDIWVDTQQKEKIYDFIFSIKNLSTQEIFEKFWSIENDLLLEGVWELKYTYEKLLDLGINNETLVIDPSISRGLNYYTGMVFETFIVGAEKMWSISSWGRYENLAEHFTKKSFPWVGGSIWLSRVLAVLDQLWKLDFNKKTPTQVLIINMSEKDMSHNLGILKTLREMNIPSEIYLDPEVKMAKQFKYADNKNIPFVLICGEEEIQKDIVVMKNLTSWEQQEIPQENITNFLQK